MYKINIGSNYPDKYGVNNVAESLSHFSTITTDDAETDFFLFPILYEILFEYSDEQYQINNFLQPEIINFRIQLKAMIDAAAKHKKKIIVFYYRDPVKKIEIPNAIVFRTSLLKSERDHEYAMPAYVQDIRTAAKISEEQFLLPKAEQPSVGFRGQAAPIDLPGRLKIKRSINKVLRNIGINKQVNLYYNFGYLARRDAIVACLKNKKIKSDLTITSAQQSVDGELAKQLFFGNIFNNQYNICVSGHGNYSFRLYEALSAGRIPVFINTDCVLPFEEFIDWKKHVIWIDEQDADKADKYILDFHNSIHPDDFLKLQQSNRLLWEEYLTPAGFFKNLHKYFDLINNKLE